MDFRKPLVYEVITSKLRHSPRISCCALMIRGMDFSCLFVVGRGGDGCKSMSGLVLFSWKFACVFLGIRNNIIQHKSIYVNKSYSLPIQIQEFTKLVNVFPPSQSVIGHHFVMTPVLLRITPYLCRPPSTLSFPHANKQHQLSQ